MGPLARTVLLLCLLAAAGCGSSMGGGDAAEPPPQPRYDLQITYWPEIYGGDQVARIEGPGLTANFNRSGGCEIARWDALAPVLELPA